MAIDLFQQSASFFDRDDQASSALLPLQIDPSTPQVTGLESATGVVLPDRAVKDRMAHFQSDLYDLRDESHLVRFMKALLGESGAGQLRKRNIVAQFQNAMQGSHFYDLDRFYGAIFGVLRTTHEVLWINPHTDVATPNEWDEIDNRDAAYRDRVFRLASAINLGASLPGIKAAAEALIESEVEVYEAWSLLDTYGGGDAGGGDPLGRTWDDMEALGTYDAIEESNPSSLLPNWNELSMVAQIGRSGNNRAEVIVAPKKDYTRIASEDGPDEADRQRAEDENALVRVLSVLKPAGVLVTVNGDGVALHRDAHITRLEADSNYWEVTTRVAPRPDLIAPEGSPYPKSLRQQLEGLLDSDRRVLPKPPWATQQAAEWSYNPEVVAVKSYTFRTGDDDDYENAGDGPITDTRTDHLITYTDGTRERFTADRAILDPRRALAARYAAEGMLVAHPYSGARQEVVTHG